MTDFAFLHIVGFVSGLGVKSIEIELKILYKIMDKKDDDHHDHLDQ